MLNLLVNKKIKGNKKYKKTPGHFGWAETPDGLRAGKKNAGRFLRP
jgi:hypothetical protein